MPLFWTAKGEREDRKETVKGTEDGDCGAHMHIPTQWEGLRQHTNTETCDGTSCGEKDTEWRGKERRTLTDDNRD